MKPSIAIRIVFLANGLMMGSVAAHLPLLKTRAGLDEGTMGLLLLTMAGAAIAAMLAGGPKIDAYGSRRGIILGAVTMILTLPWLALAPSQSLLFAVIAVFGAGNGLMDAAMNAQASSIQVKSGQAVMSSAHGFFSLGGMTAALWTALALQTGLSGAHILTISAFTMAALLMAAYRSLFAPGEEALSASKGPALAWPRGPVMAIAIIALAAFFGEGAMYDWSAIFLNEVRQTGLSYAAWGFAVFSGMMAAARLTGDRIIDHFGENTVLTASAGIAILGYIIALALPYPATTILGFGIIGLGVANIVPVLFSAAGRQSSPGTAIAAVAAFGYGGALAGPALIGFIAEFTNLTAALSFAGALLLIVLAGSRRVKLKAA